MSDNYPPNNSPEPPSGSGDGGSTPAGGGSSASGPAQGGTPTPPPSNPTPPAGSTPGSAGSTPPPPPPPPAYGAAGAAPVAQQANVGEALSWALNKFGPHAKVLVIFALVPALVSLVSTIIGARAYTFDNTSDFTAGDIAAAFGGLLLSIGALVLTWLAMIGLINAALKITKGETPELGDFWHPRRAVTYVLVSIVAAIGIAVGLVLCVIPGLILWYAWQFAQYSALATENGIVESLKESWDLVMANKVPALLALLVGVLAGVITGLPFIGAVLALFIIPVMTLFLANLYRQFRGEQVAP